MADDDSSGVGRRTLRFRRRVAPILADGPHGGVARALDVDAGGHLVTGFVPRVTLEDLLTVGPLPRDAALCALRDVAGELEVMAADGGEAHGDVKPWNVFVLPDGHATIADPHQPRDPITPAGEGAPRATRRGDAYWFGVMACEVLTGTRPLDRDDAARLLREAELPDVVRTAVLRSLQPRPQRRPLPHVLVAALATVPAAAWLPATPAPDANQEEDHTKETTAGPAAEPEPRPVDPGGPVGPVAPVDGPAPATAAAEPTGAEEPDEEGPTPPRRRPHARRVGRYVALLGILLVISSGLVGVRMIGLVQALH